MLLPLIDVVDSGSSSAMCLSYWRCFSLMAPPPTVSVGLLFMLAVFELELLAAAARDMLDD